MNRTKHVGELWDSVRVYSPHSNMAHLLPPWASPNDCEPALCGLLPALHAFGYSSWRGTGSYEEQQRAQELPTCINCERARRTK